MASPSSSAMSRPRSRTAVSRDHPRIGELVFAMSLRVPILRWRGLLSANRVVCPRARHHLRAADPGCLPARDLHLSATAAMFPSPAAPLGACSRVRDNPSASSSSATAHGCATSRSSSPASPAASRSAVRAEFRDRHGRVFGAGRSGGYLLFTFSRCYLLLRAIIGAVPAGVRFVILSDSPRMAAVPGRSLFMVCPRRRPGQPNHDESARGDA